MSNRTAILFLLFSLALQLYANNAPKVTPAKAVRSLSARPPNKQTHALAERCQCGRHLRNRTSVRTIGGKQYDTFAKMGDGLDGNVEHAFSRALGRCVAVKTCSEDQARLNKCTREVEIMRRLNGARHTVKLLDSELQRNQPCTEGAVVSDYVRMILIGSDKKRRKRSAPAKNDSCVKITSVMELGEEDAEHYWKERKKGRRPKGPGLAEIRRQIGDALQELHAYGIAHRDMHYENAVFFAQPGSPRRTIKIIDFGWACCFDARKCGRKVASLVPQCKARTAIKDDEYSLKDLVDELASV